MSDKWDEVDALAQVTEVETVADNADRQAIAIAKAQQLKEATSKCAKAIHLHGGEDYVWEQLASGVTTTKLCESLGFSVVAFRKWVERGGDARVSSYARAKSMAGDSLAEQTLDLADSLDRADVTSAQVTLAKLRSDNRWRMAAALNKETYGNAPAQININIGDIALSALRKREVIDVDAKSLDE